MLFLERKHNQELELTLEDGRVILLRLISHSHPDLPITIGISAPKSIRIIRSEIKNKE